MRSSVTESTVGIARFMNTAKGFQGILKQRYADFIVREVDLEGNIVRLTDIAPPKKVP
jgi:tRNA pseudouridine13 synthase